MADVFISYHIASAAHIVHKISADLEARGISCWYSRVGVRGGEDFARMVVPEIEKCKVFLLILDHGSVDSRHVETELKLAFDRFNREEVLAIIPFQIDKCNLSSWMKYYLATIQIINKECSPWLSASPKVEKRIEQIVQFHKGLLFSETNNNPAKSSAVKSAKAERNILKRQRLLNYIYNVFFEYLVCAIIALVPLLFNVLYESHRNNISFVDALKNSSWGFLLLYLILLFIFAAGYINNNK